jgi:hypothetical protein
MEVYMKMIFLVFLLLIFTVVLVSGCKQDYWSELNKQQHWQLECSDALIANLDRCDDENPEGSVRNVCYREVINGFRVCLNDQV